MGLKYQFAIKKEVLNSGKEIFTPMVRTVKRFLLWDIHSVWQRISLVENKYVLLELDFIPDLSFEECVIRIEEYKNIIDKYKENNIKITEFLNLEDKEQLNLK